MANKVMRNMALGATGIALAAGAVATGVALSDKKNRSKLSKGVKQASKKLNEAREAFNQTKDRFQAYQHKIGLRKRKSQAKSLKKA